MRTLASLSVLLCLGLLGALVAADRVVAEDDAKSPRRATSPRDEALVALGRRLFFDPAISRSGARSCASCHDPDHGFSDPGRVSDDDFGRTRRHSQTLLDGHLNPSAHWDGEFATVEELVLARIGSIKGRKGKLGHGSTLEDALSEQFGGEPSGPFTEPAEETSDQTDPLPEDEREKPREDKDYDGGGREFRAPTSSGDQPSARGPATPSSPSGMTAPAAGAAEAPPDAKDAPAAEPKPAPAAEPQAGKDPAAEPKVEPKRDDPQEAEAKRDDPETLRRKADALRAKLAKLPLAEDVIEQGGRYDEAFTAAFGNPRVNAQRIARAIGAYSRSIASTTSPYDRFAAGQLDALSESAKRGLSLFQGEGRCATCHTLEGSHAALTDFGFHNTGVVWNRLSEDDRQRLAAHDETFRRKQDDLERPAAADEGRARISTRKGDLRAFKTPTLRDVARRGPYMHDGSFATLRDVVAYYARGASPDPAKASHVRAFAANERDVDDLVAFLESLNGEERPGLPAKAWRERADRTQLQFVDADGRPLAGLDVELAAVGDLAHAGAEIHAVPARLRTDDKGLIEFCNRRTTHTRLALPGGLVPTDGALVPDSCRKARVRVPVRGRTTLLVRFGDGVEPPAVLAAEHLGTIELPGHDRPRTRFARGDVLDLGRGTLVRYEAWLRTDVPASVQLRVPGLDEAKSHFVLERDQPIRVDLTTK